MKVKLSVKPLVIALSLFGATAALADITIGVSVSATGPAAVLGVPEKNTIEMLPTSIAGEKINWIVLDEASDPTLAAKNMSKLTAENKVDLLIAGTTTTTALAAATAAGETKTPLFALAPNPADGEKLKWTFTPPQHFGLMAESILEHMKANNYKTLGFIGYADAYGEDWIKAINASAAKHGVTLGPIERFQRTDTSVTGQAVKLLAAKPDAIIVVASGAPAAMPHSTLNERGYKGQIYQTHGGISPALLKIGGKNVEGGILVSGPLFIWDQLPDSHPSKKPGGEYAKLYEGKYGPGTLSSFGGHVWDSWTLASKAIPLALKKAKPGTAEFRSALRDAIETEKNVIGVHGVFNMTPADHYGHDHRARTLVQIQNGAYKLISK